MKVKFTLQRAGGSVDLTATLDAATTVGELAQYLAAADPRRASAESAQGELTLSVCSGQMLALDRRQPVAESGLRSGTTVSISRAGSSYADPQRPAAAIVRVLDGPDAGREFSIGQGASTVGRDRGCEVRLTDTMVSRRHARINVTDVVEIIDLGSANGIQIDELAVPRSILRAADVVQIGDTRLSVRMIQAAAAPAQGGPAVGFVRSPRLDPYYEGDAFEAPELPERPGHQRIPLIPMIAPLLMGALLFLLTRSAMSIIFVALSPVMMIGNAVESRISGRRAYKEAVADFRSDVDALVSYLETARTAEQAARRREHPSTVECVDAAGSGSPLLWTRRPGERGFGELRLGLGALPSRSVVEMPSTKRATRDLFRELSERIAPLRTVEDVPVVAALGESALGVGGPRTHSVPVASALLVQLAVLHSPAELVITAAVSSHAAADWDWLKWLPHTSSAASPISARGLTSSSTAGVALIAELEDLLEQRSGDRNESAAPLPSIVLLVEADAPVEHSRLVGLAEAGAAHGIHLLWVAPEVVLLPAACKVYVELGRDGSSARAGYVHTGTAVTPLAVDSVDAQTAAAVAHGLAPVVDLGARTADASDLPRAVSLLALNGPELAGAPEAVLERWAESRSLITGPFAPSTPPRHAGSLRAVVGEAAGQKLALDLRVDGPHALVGGTTGAGKSELLQAWILAMAAAHSPQRLTFLLVDYKGGSAFRDCVDLPHTVGLVTDLSPHLVRRALTSLSAELRYREHLLAKHAAKDLVTLEKQGVAEAPPSLVIVVDEFAALVNEVPEFVDGVVNVAQRGRSLGLHLILATQRPAGVIKDNLRANTNLRLALRMADEADSTDVLGSPEAAFFDAALPGRAVSKTGPGRLVPFQTGYAGGWTTDAPPPPDILVEELTLASPAVWERPESEDAVADDPGPTDIRRLVDSIGQASVLAQVDEPRKPWLPELLAVYDLADQAQVPTRRSDTELVFGVRDDPENQAQPTVAFHPDRDGNLAVYGTGGSGKSTLLRTLAVAAGFTVRGGPCHLYGIDFGARGLAMLEELPHVGSIISGSDHERILRLLGWLRELIDERALRYSRLNAATITDYRRLSGTADEPRILLLVDGIAAFRQAYESTDRLRWFDTFTSIAADGRPVGVHVVLSSDQRGGLTTALASAVQSRIVLRLATADDYSVLGVAGDVLTAASPAGRGLFSDSEMQVAVLGGTPDVVSQGVAVRAFADAMRKSGGTAASPIGTLPDRVELGALPATIDGDVVIGLSSTTLAPFAVERRGLLLVAGPPGSGRTTALLTIVEALRRSDPLVELYYFGSRRSSLATLPYWRERAFAADAADRAAALAASLAARAGTGSSVAVVIEGIDEFVNGPADNALQDLVKVCLAEDHLLVAEGETSTLSSSYGLLGQVKSGRTGLALQPDQSDGSTLFRTDFPRTSRAAFPQGRALFARMGKADVVQVALPPGPAREGGVLPIDAGARRP